jgi:exonuclease VII large subunit
MDNFAHVPDMEGLRAELNQHDTQIRILKYEKKTTLRSIEDLKVRLTELNSELESRRESPHMYPTDAGAGDESTTKAAITAMEAALERFTEKAEDFEQPLEEFEEDRNKVLFVMADKIGIDVLRNERTRIGKEMTKMNRLQHTEYEAQKERYEACKARFEKNNPGKKFKYSFLLAEDRAYIESLKGLNQGHLDAWLILCDQRQEICDMIDAYDPDDQDLGLGEDDA